MGALATYRAQTLALLNDPAGSIYTQPQFDANINSARLQTAGDGECIRRLLALDTIAGQQSYDWSSSGIALPSGIGGILNVRDISRVLPVGVGKVKLYGRPWEWLSSFKLQSAGAAPGIPTRWAPFQSGESGVFYLDPTPDGVYPLQLDTVCLPIVLVDDNTAEALLFPWTDAVQYFAAYLCFLDQMRTADADSMFSRYRLFARRGTQLTTPTQLPDNFPGGAGAQQAMGRDLVGGPAERQR